MKRNASFVLAVFCASLLPVLLLGYFGNFGPEISWFEPRGPTLRDDSISLERGCVSFRTVIIRGSMPNGVPASMQKPGMTLHWLGRIWPPRHPDFRRSMWGFDAVFTHFGVTSGNGFGILAFPIWCILLPCLIPIGLLARKRRRLVRVGFEVGQ